ncbi:carbohydrate-binding domain-containing protein [Fibrobacter sp.]|uniref:carbohydrate-binding domain-containing protein n=1 Tax=Fibrobacter sp. TaxID=35828 RepID=UPI0038902397
MKCAKLYLVCSAALALSACGDSSTATSAEQGETATSITCSDGKVVSNLNECATITEVPVSSAQTTASDNDQGGNPPQDNGNLTSSSFSDEFTPSCASNSDNNLAPVTPIGGGSADTEDDDNVELKGDEATLTFSGSDVTIANDNGCLKKEAAAVTVSCSGNYYLTGSASDFQVIVNTADNDTGKVDLFLNTVSLKSSDAPIYVQHAEKTELHLVKGTTNTIEDGASRTKTHTYTTANGQKVDTTNAAIYAKDDLSFKGSGTLTVKGNFNNGIHCSNDVKFKKSVGTLTVEAKNHGVKGKGSVTINGGNINITTAEGDGIKSDEDDATKFANDKGVIKIAGGTITINSATDGITASNAVQIEKGENVEAAPVIKVTAGGGQTCLVASSSNNGGGRGGFGGGFGMGGNSCQDSVSKKGIKGDSSITVTAGNIDVNSRDDGFHSNGDITISGGKMTIKSDDDGIHADNALYIKGDANVDVTMAYEGMEAYEMHFEGGVTSVNTTDDGWNAAGGTDNSGVENNGGGWGGPGGGFGGGGPGGFGGFGGGTTGKLYVTGGVHYVKVGSGDTDGVDSNGSIDISGGVLIIECLMNGGMGGMMDSDGQTNITGGIVLGFGVGRSEAGQNYSVSFNTNGYYGVAGTVAFKPTISGSNTISNQGQPAAVSGTEGLTKTCFGASTTNCVYYKN